VSVSCLPGLLNGGQRRCTNARRPTDRESDKKGGRHAQKDRGTETETETERQRDRETETYTGRMGGQ
jgi:hypothetical protein